MPTATNLQTRTGNRIIVTLMGIQVGALQSLRMNDDYGLEPASGIGDIHVIEYVPTVARHTVNVNAMVLNKGSLYKMGIAPENANAVLLGTVFDIENFDKDSNILIRKYQGCSYASGDYEVTKHAIVMQTAVFNCLDVSGIAT
jgi:hypothetical protein